MENWRDIPGYENLYQASDQGNIRTCEGKVTSNARFSRRVWKQRVLKQKTTKKADGRIDARVNLWKDGKEKTCLVSRLVALTWVDGYTSQMTVNHKDGNPLNNTASNLEWLTLGDNIRHGFDNGLYTCCKPIRLKSKGVVRDFRSLEEANSFLRRSHGYVSLCLKRNHPIKDADGNKYEIESVV